MADNRLATKEGGEVLSELLLKNSVVSELDLSDNSFYASPEEQSDGVAFARVENLTHGCT